MKIIGLTGGIASGKSTVQEMLRAHGAHVLDADAIYHEMVAARGGAPQWLTRQINERFRGVIAPDGSLDRPALAARVFEQPSERRALDRIAHPAVAAEVARRTDQCRTAGCPLLLYDVPLLFERGLETGMDGVIVVWVPFSMQLARLRHRDGLSETDAHHRIAAQGPLDAKRDRATWVIDNSGDRQNTAHQVDRVWQQLQRMAGDAPG